MDPAEKPDGYYEHPAVRGRHVPDRRPRPGSITTGEIVSLAVSAATAVGTLLIANEFVADWITK